MTVKREIASYRSYYAKETHLVSGADSGAVVSGFNSGYGLLYDDTPPDRQIQYIWRFYWRNPLHMGVNALIDQGVNRLLEIKRRACRRLRHARRRFLCL